MHTGSCADTFHGITTHADICLSPEEARQQAEDSKEEAAVFKREYVAAFGAWPRDGGKPATPSSASKRAKFIPGAHPLPATIIDLKALQALAPPGAVASWSHTDARFRIFYVVGGERQTTSARTSLHGDRGAAIVCLSWAWRVHHSCTGEQCPYDLSTVALGPG